MTATGPITIANNYVNGASTTLDMNTRYLSLDISKATNNGTVQFGGESNGVLIASGAVEYNGNVSQTIAGHATNTYTSLIFSGSGEKLITALAGKVRTLGSLNATSAINVGAGADLQIDGDFLVGTAAITNDGTITVGNN
jgi:hypothetical protein